MKSLRVLMIAASPFPFPQGSQVLVAALAEGLQARGHRVEIVAYPSGEGHVPSPVPLHRCPALPFYRQLHPRPSLGKPLSDLILARKAWTVARENHPDVLHTHNFEGLLVALWLRRRIGTPVVYHMHNLMEPELPAYFRFRPGRWAGRLFGRWVDYSLPRRADACIALSDQAAELLLRRGVARERIHVIPPGVSIPEPTADPPEKVRRRWGLGPGPLVLYSGNLDRYQDLAFLRQAFPEVRRRIPDAILVLATHQRLDAPRERALGKGLDAGEFLVTPNTWEEMRGLLETADVAVSPRQVCWGFPIKVLNYMAAGRPIVAAAGSAQGLRHLETGWVVPNGDVPALAQAITVLLEDRELAGRLGQASRLEVERRYSASAQAEAVEQLYRYLSFGQTVVK